MSRLQRGAITVLNCERKFKTNNSPKATSCLLLVVVSFILSSFLAFGDISARLILILIVAFGILAIVVLWLCKRQRRKKVRAICKLAVCVLLGFHSFVLFSLLTVIGDKPVWSLLNLLIVPAVLAFGVWWLRKRQDEIEREIAQDERQQDALQYYLDRMTELLPDHQTPGVRDTMRWQTLVALRALDGRRKGQTLRFLHEHGLIGGTNPIINLRHAELKEADLIVGLPEHWGLGGEWDEDTLFRYYERYNEKPDQDDERWRVDLSEVNLTDADLFKAAFVLTNLESAYLRGTYLANAYLMGANLRGADLRGADLTNADLTGAIYDRKTKRPGDFDLEEQGARLIEEDRL